MLTQMAQGIEWMLLSAFSWSLVALPWFFKDSFLLMKDIIHLDIFELRV